jgi:hypothetical protein
MNKLFQIVKKKKKFSASTRLRVNFSHISLCLVRANEIIPTTSSKQATTY